MGYDKGRSSKRVVASAHPHQVTIKIPELGLGVITDAIHPKMREIAGDAHASWSQRAGADFHAVHGFKTEGDAAAFRAWITEHWPHLLDLTPTRASERIPCTFRSH